MKTIGVYLRASAQTLENLIAESIMVTLSVLVDWFAHVFYFKTAKCNFCSYYVLVKLVQRITRQRDYSSRAEMHGIKELDILGGAFNNML